MSIISSRIIPSVLAFSTLLLFDCTQSEAAISVAPSNLGNVFYTGHTVSIPLTASAGSSINWSVTDYYGHLVSTGSTAVIGGATTILPVTNGELGYFALSLSEMTGTTVSSANSTQFTIIAPPPAQTNSPYGAQTHFAADLPSPTPLAIATLLAEAGITQIRDEQYWNNVENPKGTFTWPSSYINYMSTAASSGLTPLVTLDWANQYYDYSGGQFTGPTTSTGLAGFGNYALQLLNKWNSQLPTVEVWDEYNGSFLSGPATANSPLYYYDLLKAVYTSIKPAYPNVKIVGMATYPIADGFIQSVLQQGGNTGNSYVDIFSVHPYRAEPEGVDLEVADLLNLIKGYNGGVAKPIWATEFSLGGTSPAEYLQEPSYLARMVAQMQTAGVAKMFYYTVQDDSGTPYRGLVGAADSSRGNYLANPVYAAYANTINQLYGWTPTGRFTSGIAQSTYIYPFKSGSNTRYVCWGGSGFSDAPTRLTMTIPSPAASVTDIMGNTATFAATNGNVTINIPGVNPLYITITGGSASTIMEAANPVLADSVAGYSGTQGYNGWSYGAMSGSTYNQSGFSALPWQIWSSDEYRWNAPGGYPFMTIDQMHPGGNGFVVRRWTSTISGTVTISGTITPPGNSNSTGVYCAVYVNGTAAYSPPLIASASPAVAFSIPNIPIAAGTVVDFVESPNGNNYYDATGWIMRITAQSYTYAQWKTSNFGSSANNPSVAGDTVSPAGDGIPNLLKYALGLNPLTSTTTGITVSQSGNILMIKYPRADAATDATAHAYWSNDLRAWSNSGVTETLLSDDNTIQWWQASIPAGPQNSRLFLKLQVTGP